MEGRGAEEAIAEDDHDRAAAGAAPEETPKNADRPELRNSPCISTADRERRPDQPGRDRRNGRM